MREKLLWEKRGNVAYNTVILSGGSDQGNKEADDWHGTELISIYFAKMKYSILWAFLQI